jgi:UDP-N-acetylmuramyl tripeptide synthase
MVTLWRNMYRRRNNWGHRLRAAASMTSSTVPGGAAARMTPEDFLEELDTKRPDIDLGLGKSLELLARVGDPQNKLRVVHVAGTNGKGSVCAMIASILRAAGKKVRVHSSSNVMRSFKCLPYSHYCKRWASTTRHT